MILNSDYSDYSELSDFAEHSGFIVIATEVLNREYLIVIDG